jgi:ribosome maturation factor RimP
MSTKVKALVEQMVLPYLNEHGFELVDIEYAKEGSNWFLRVFVDKENGIDIDDCGKISEYLSEQLDAKDPIPNAYFLEVSSPGAERPLKKKEDFLKAINRNVFVTTYEPWEGGKQFEGILLEYDEQQLTIAAGKKKQSIPLDKIASARTAVTF